MTTLIREQPFSAAVESSLLQSVCHGCFSYCRKEQLKCCSGCSAVYYCGVQCQRNDWPDHSAECRCLKNYSPRVPSCFVRLLARFYWKMSTHGSDVVSFNSRCCYDLLDKSILHILLVDCQELVKSSRHMEYFSSLFNILVEYMNGTDVASGKQAMFSAYGKLVTNAFSITDSTGKTLGTGLYLGISAQDHSCTPDAFVRFEGATAVMSSPDVGRKYDRNLTISYVDLMGLTEERNKILRDQFCFLCTCSACISKAQDEWKRSVSTSCCDGGFCLVDPNADWETSPPLCVLCKKQVDMDLNQALEHNASAKVELEDKAGVGARSPSEDFERWSLIFEKFVKVLSPYNTYLVAIYQKFLSAAESIGRTDLTFKYADILLDAYRRYLPIGHPELTQRLRLAYLRKVQGCLRQNCRALLSEAYNSAVRSHGENHEITVELSSHLST